MLLDIVSKLPGIRFLELRRRTGLANGVLAYHLGILEKQSQLRVDRGPGYADFYPVSFEPVDVPVFNMIRHDRSRGVIIFLLASREATQKEIALRIGISPSTASWYLGRLLKADIVISKHSGRQTLYRLKDPERLQKLLSVYQSTWKDKMVDRFASMWESTGVIST